MSRPSFIPDNFTFALMATVAAATILPCSGDIARVLDVVTTIAIGLLFFFHGAKLPREAVVAGIGHWRLHVLVFASTFLMFPILGYLLKPLAGMFVTPELYLGILFLCMLPSTVQSSIALTAMAKGNVPAAICSASASNLIGIFLTPLLVGMIVSANVAGGSSIGAVEKIMLQLLLPFVLGQFSRRWIGAWIDKRKSVLKFFDQGSILLVVYTAFSEAVIQGIWSRLPLQSLAGLVFLNCLLLAIALGMSTFASRRLGFNKEDEVAIVFCGSKKSLASGVPMAKVLFTSQAIGMIVLPLMIFHQIQLMVCAVLAQRYAQRER